MLSLAVLAATAVLPFITAESAPNPYDAADVSTIYFEENGGQFDGRVRYFARGTDGHALFLTDSEAVFVVGGPASSGAQLLDKSGNRADRATATAVFMRLAGSDASARPVGIGRLDHRTNYFKGSDARKWQTGIANYRQAITTGAYDGIDIVWRGATAGRAGYELIVGPDADVSRLVWEIEGADAVKVDADGGLVLETGTGHVYVPKPVTARSADGTPRIEGRYQISGEAHGGSVLVQLVPSDYSTAELRVADEPSGTGGLRYSTYLGGNAFDAGLGIAVDASGSSYVTGLSSSANFPTTPGVFDPTHSGLQDVFVTKFNPEGSGLVYSTYIGGATGDQANAIEIDPAGNVYLTGVTQSADYPTTPGALDTTYNGGIFDSFVTKLNADGTALIYSTFLGGNSDELGYGIVLDSDGNAYVTGDTESAGFPVTAGAYDPTINLGQSFFVSKLDPLGATLVYSTYLGSQSFNYQSRIALDAVDNAVVSGATDHGTFPTTPGAFDTTHNGAADVFVTKFNSTGTALSYSTFIGGSNNDIGQGIDLDTLGNAYIAGSAGAGFPTTPGAYDTSYNNSGDFFVTKLNPTGSGLVYSTYIGGTSVDAATGITLDPAGNAYITGNTSSTTFPTTPGAVSSVLADVDDDIIIAKLNNEGNTLLYSTYLGARFDDAAHGIAVDSAGMAYVTGEVVQIDFPTTPGAFDRILNGGGDAFVVKLDPSPASPTPPIVSPGKIAFQTDRDGNTEIYVMNSDGTNQTRLTNNTATDSLPALSPDGSKIAFVSNRDGNNEIYAMNADGTGQTRLTTATGSDSAPSFSVDGSHIVFSSGRDGNGEIYTMNADGTGQTRLTTDPASDAGPSFGPGDQIVFTSNRNGNFEVYIMDADGSNQTRLTNNTLFDTRPSFSPSGNKILFQSSNDGTNTEAFIMDLDGSNKTQVTAGHFSSESAPDFSPDGVMITFTSDFHGNPDVYVIDLSAPLDQIRLTTHPSADQNPSWGPGSVGPTPTPNTPVGTNVNVPAPSGDASATFPTVTQAGNTTFTPINPPSSAGPPPPGYTILGSGPAYDITTTAIYTPPVVVCFTVSSITDQAEFARARILHGENGQLVDRTILAPDSPAPDFPTRRVCARVDSLSPFVAALIDAPTASDGTVTGRIVADDGTPVEGAVVRLSGTQNRKFITDANGFYSFDYVETNGFYTVTPSRANYTFNPSSRSFSQLGETTEATFGATATSVGFVNPLDTPEYFVRQHYLDFLGREPDESGFNFWSDQILECANDNQCIDRRRENVSAAYFLSIEFQQTGGLVDGLYQASYGVRPQFAEFMPDARAVGLGVVVGAEGWQARLQANKEAFVNAFVNRPAFINVYGGMSNDVYVDTLISHTGVTFTSDERAALAQGLATGTMTRAEVLRSIAENSRFVNAKFNEAFVMMEYFGYLRRDPDANGYAFWLNKLNQFGGNFEQAEMVKAFIVSGEYRDRFPR